MVPELHTQLMMLISAKSPQKEMKSIWINQTKETRFFIFNTIFNDPKKKKENSYQKDITIQDTED